MSNLKQRLENAKQRRDQLSASLRTHPQASQYKDIYDEAVQRGMDPGWAALIVEGEAAKSREVPLATALGEGFAPPQLEESFERNMQAFVSTLWEMPGIVGGAFKELATLIGATQIRSSAAWMGADADHVKIPNLLDSTESPVISNFFIELAATGVLPFNYPLLKKRLREDPFGIFLNIMPAVGKFAKLGRSPKLPEGAQMPLWLLEKAENIDPLSMSAGIMGYGFEKGARGLRMGKADFDPDVTMTAGREGTGAGRSIEWTKSMRQLAEEQGAGLEDTPISILTDDQRQQIGTGILLHQGGEAAHRERQRVHNSQAAIKQREIEIRDRELNKTSQTDTPIYDSHVVGKNALERYHQWQLNQKQSVGSIFENYQISTKDINLIDEEHLSWRKHYDEIDDSMKAVPLRQIDELPQITPEQSRILEKGIGTDTPAYQAAIKAQQRRSIIQATTKTFNDSDFPAVQAFQKKYREAFNKEAEDALSFIQTLRKRAEQTAEAAKRDINISDIDGIGTGFYLDYKYKNELSPVWLEAYQALRDDLYHNIDKAIEQGSVDPDLISLITESKNRWAQRKASQDPNTDLWTIYLPNYTELKAELKSKYSNEANRVIDAADNLLKEAADQAKALKRPISVADLDGIGTSYHQALQLFPVAELQKIGDGKIGRRIYVALREDLYQNLDRISANNPMIPKEMTQDLRQSKRAWSDIRKKLETRAATYLDANRNSPEKIVDDLIKGRLPDEDINQIFDFVGEAGTADLRAAGLYQLFESAQDRRGGWNPAGLANALGDESRKNQLRALFGDDDLMKELTELGTFSAQFQKLDRVTKNSPTGFINEVLQGGTPQVTTGLIDRVETIYHLVDGGAGWFEKFKFVGALVDQHLFSRWLQGESARRWMLSSADPLGKVEAASRWLRTYRSNFTYPIAVSGRGEETREQLERKTIRLRDRTNPPKL